MTDLRYKLIPLLLLFQANILQSLAELAGNYTTGVDELVFAHVSGKQMQYQLGKFLRRRYDRLIGPGYSPNKVYIRSSDTDRTLMSAQCNAAGLFEPLSANQRWNDYIDNWQPVPVHTTRLDEDYLVYQSIPCAKSDQQQSEYLQSKEVLAEFQKHSQLCKYLEENSGSKIRNVGDLHVIAEALLIEHGRGLPLDDWALNVIPQLTDLFDKLSVIWFTGYIRTNDTLKARGGFLVREILERFKNKTMGILKPDRSLWIYSAHDNTLVNTLSILNIFDGHGTPFGASIHLELYKSGRNREYYVQVFYRKNNSEEHLPPIEIPNCGTKCSLDRFLGLYADILPRENDTYDALCKL